MRTETKRSAAASAANEQWKLSAHCVGRAKFARSFYFILHLAFSYIHSLSIYLSLCISHSCFADFTHCILIHMANLLRLALGNGLLPLPTSSHTLFSANAAALLKGLVMRLLLYNCTCSAAGAAACALCTWHETRRKFVKLFALLNLNEL